MKIKPPQNQIKGKIQNIKRYIGRVHEVKSDTLCMNIWEWFGDRYKFGAKYFYNIDRNTAGVSRTGKFFAGTPIEVWTWQELVKGKVKERAHIRSLD